MRELCIDTLSHCLFFLDVKEIVLNCSLVNKQWLKCSRSNNIWKNIYNVLFMDTIFNWRSQTTNDEKKKSSDSKVSKKQKFDESTDSYWFNLVKQFMIFPTCDNHKQNIAESAFLDKEGICKIKNVDTLHEIIFHLQQNNSDSTKYYYNCERFATKSHELKENYLRLALLLTVMFGGKQDFSTDYVVISLGEYNSNENSDEEDDEKESEEKFVCPLPTFCMLVLHPDSQDLLPFKEEDEEEMYFRAAPYLEDSNNSDKDYCFFTMLDDYCSSNVEVSVGTRVISFSGSGIPWCPTYFNAGGRIEINKISACFIDDGKSILVERFDDYSYE